MGTMLSYHITAARPIAKLWLKDDDGSLIDFSAGGYSFLFRVGEVGEAALLELDSGQVDGATGAGSEPDGTPNITITWVAGDLDIVSPTGRYPVVIPAQLTATIGGLPRIFEGAVELKDVIAAPA